MLNNHINEITDYSSLAITNYATILVKAFNKHGVSSSKKHWANSMSSRSKLCHFHYSNSSYKVILPLISNSILQRKCFVTIHDVIPRNKLFRTLISPFFYFIMTLAAQKLIVHSDAAKSLVHNSYPFVPKNKVVVIPLGCDLKTPPKDSFVAKLRIKWDKPVDSIILLSLGYLKRSKGIIELIEAFSMVKKTNLLLIIVGKTIDSEVSTALNKHKDKRIFEYGFVSNNDLDELLQLSDALVNFRLDSVGESSAAILDMFSYGKPALVSNVGSNIEVIDTAGLITKPDALLIANTLIQYCENSDLRLKLKQSVVSVRKRYEIGLVARQYLKLFKIN